ncbi:MAG: NUMOD3 domain-containing DNA-binding protein [candidate division Zixibacteria bacterium]|nr:NUMOD3 domain-containing DNA-binding protein [candidate division Zixibacteria bacterium]
MKEKALGRHPSEEARKNMSIAQLGRHHSEETKRKIGDAQLGEKNHMFGKHHPPWNKGKHWKLPEDAKRKISESRLGNKHPLWKGNEVSYRGLHHWIQAHKPCQTNCALCGKVKPLELANLSGEYKRDIEDFMWTCRQCHRKFDTERKNGN